MKLVKTVREVMIICVNESAGVKMQNETESESEEKVHEKLVCARVLLFANSEHISTFFFLFFWSLIV